MNVIEAAKKAGLPNLTDYGYECLERLVANVRAEYEAPLKLADEALDRVINDWVAPDDMPFEDGEIPALDNARKALAAIREVLDHSGDANEMVADQPNLSCPSVQARLATVWGYVKAEPVKQEPVANAALLKRMALALEVCGGEWRESDPLLRMDIAEAIAAPVEPLKQEPVACQDSDDRRLLREIFMLCEATEEIEATNDFMRGRIFEAKGIRRGIGTWYQDTFCGRSYMGEPVIPSAPVDAKAIREQIAAEAFRTGSCAELEAVYEEFISCMQSDLEHGIKSSNERAAEIFKKNYPQMYGFCTWLNVRISEYSN